MLSLNLDKVLSNLPIARRQKVSLILWMVERNLPLGHFKKYSGSEETRAFGIHTSKRPEETARKIVGGLSQYDVAKQVAKEWEIFPPLLRMRITDFCASNSHSGNVRKGISYLDELLKGKIRRRETGPTERRLVERGGKLISEQRGINPAVAGAERAFAILSKPANYDKMTPAEKRRYNNEAARIRRGEK